MTVLDIIARLIITVNANDTATTARLLEGLEAMLPPEEVIEILEAILGEQVEAPSPPLAACS